MTGSNDPGTWLTKDANTAGFFSEMAAERELHGMPSRYDFDWAASDPKGFAETYGNKSLDYIRSLPPRAETIYPLAILGKEKSFIRKAHGNNQDAVNKAKHSVVIFPDGSFSDPGVTAAVTDPSRIRSRFAAFNPAKRDSADILASISPFAVPMAAGMLGAAALTGSEDASASDWPQPRFGYRPDGTPKGEGWLGVLPMADGSVVTEYSMQSRAVKVGDKMVEFPTLVPTLSSEEVNLMLSDIIPNRKPIPEPIVQKAIEHAKGRLNKGLSPFKELGK